MLRANAIENLMANGFYTGNDDTGAEVSKLYAKVDRKGEINKGFRFILDRKRPFSCHQISDDERSKVTNNDYSAAGLSLSNLSRSKESDEKNKQQPTMSNSEQSLGATMSRPAQKL